MSLNFTCPDCGEEHPAGSEERIGEPDTTVARRSTGFSGGITSLNDMNGSFAFVVELPCGCRIITVN
jgi:hypothetical protein